VYSSELLIKWVSHSKTEMVRQPKNIVSGKETRVQFLSLVAFTALYVSEVENTNIPNYCNSRFYTPPCPGICILVWDNMDSKWSSRTIK